MFGALDFGDVWTGVMVEVVFQYFIIMSKILHSGVHMGTAEL